MTTKFEQLWKSIEDKEMRREFNLDFDTSLAFQIKLLREKNGWTQQQLAERVDSKQETISQWENPNYGKYTVKTIKSLATAFDVGLMVKFAPFSEVIEWNANLTPERLAPPSFDEEEAHARYQPSQFVHPAERGKPSTIAAGDHGLVTEVSAITATHIEPSAHPADAVIRWVMGGTAIEPKESDCALAA